MMNSYSNNERMDVAMSRITVMLRQEETAYFKKDYLCANNYNNKTDTTGPTGPDACLDINATSRLAMLDWVDQVIDCCKFNNETTEITMSYIDRYLSTSIGSLALYDRTLFQCVCMTALYTAVKINEPTAMDPKFVSLLSKGQYTPTEIEQLEQKLLSALNWRMNPPTSLSFCRELLTMIPEHLLDTTTRSNVYELVKIQSKVMLREYEYIHISASTIAYCSLMNALDCLVLDCKALSMIRAIVRNGMGMKKMIVDGCCYYNDNEINRVVQSFLYDTVLSDLQQEQSGTVTTSIHNNKNNNNNKVENKTTTSIGSTTPTNTTSKVSPKREVLRTKSPQSVAALNCT